MVQPRTRLLVGDPRADDHDPGRPVARRGDRRRHARRRLAAGRSQGVGFSGRLDGGVGFGGPKPSIDGSGASSPSTPARRRLISGEWRATTMRPCAPNRRRHARSRHHSASATVPTSSSHCVTDFAGNVELHGRPDLLRRQQPAGAPARARLAGGEEWRRTNDFDPSWINPDQGPASPIGGAFWRITGPAGYDSGVKFVAGRDLHGLRTSSSRAPAPTRSASGCATRPATRPRPRRRRCRCASTTCPQASPSSRWPPGTRSRTRSAAQIADDHSGPASGEIHYRRLDGEQWTELPAKFQRGESADSAALLARLPSDLRPGTYVFRADAVDAAGNAASTTRRVRRHRDDRAQGRRASPVAGVKRAEPVRAKARIFARLRWRGRSGTELTVPFRVAATLSGRLLDADGAGLGRSPLRVVSRPSRGALGKATVEAVQTGPARWLPAPAPGRHLAADRGLLSGRRAASMPRAQSADAAGPQWRRAPRLPALAADRRAAVHFGGRVRSLGAPLPRRGKLVAIQYYESAAKALAPGPGYAQRSRRSLSRLPTGSATSAARPASGSGPCVLPEERWPYAPGASRPVVVRVTG